MISKVSLFTLWFYYRKWALTCHWRPPTRTYSTYYKYIGLTICTSILKWQWIINNNRQLLTMLRCCTAADCDSVYRKDWSFYKFPQDEAITNNISGLTVKQQRSNLDGPSPHSLLQSKHFWWLLCNWGFLFM